MTLNNIEKATEKNLILEEYYRKLGFDSLANHCKETAAALNEALTIIHQLTDIPTADEKSE